MRLTTEKIQSLSQAVLEIYRPLPATELPRHFLSILGNLISTEYTVYNELNPKSGFVSATCDRELPPDLMPLIPVFEKHMLENPLIPILFAKPEHVAATRVSDHISLREYERTDIYNQFYIKVDANFQLACGISTHQNEYIALVLNRKHSDFTEEEVFTLETLRPHVQRALATARSLDLAKNSIFSMMERSQPPGTSLLCFNGDFRVTHISNAAEDLASAVFGCRPLVGQLLPSILKTFVLKSRSDRNLEIPKAGHRLSVAQGNGSSLHVRLSHDPENLNHCLIFEHETSLVRPEQLRALGLSPRETEIAFWIFHKKTSWEMSRILHISTRTVEKHVENIFRKMQVDDRNGLAAKASQLCRF